MTTLKDIQMELRSLHPNDPEGAAVLYRKACAAGLAWAGLSNVLLRLQTDDRALAPVLSAIAEEFPGRRG